MRKRWIAIWVLALDGGLGCRAQSSTPQLDSARAIDWSQAGVEVPTRPILCARLRSPASEAEINTALRACPSGQTVYLEPGRYEIGGTVTVPSSVTLRGAGADQTILDANGHNHGYVVALGTARVNYQPVRIVSGADAAGSQSIMLENAARIAVGNYLVISESNDPAFVNPNGVDGNCRWCDGEWSSTGQYSRGQIVEVTAVRGDKISFSPGLYSSYTHMPFAVSFVMSAHHAGVEDLQVYANNTGYDANFGMNTCAYCWIKGVASNYTDGDHVELLWGFHDEVLESYFSNAYTHLGGAHDADIRISTKTTASLIENNIVERTHAAIMFSFGPAGNVVAFNYTTGEFDTHTPDMVTGGIVFHAAHPQFNLLEGNIVPQIYLDANWGSSSHTTLFRNWALGTNRVCQPLTGRAPVSCAGAKGRHGFCEARALQISYLSKWNTVVGNILGSKQMANLTGWSGRRLPVEPVTEFPARRSWDAVAYDVTIGYGGDGDDGTGSGCASGGTVCHAGNLGDAQWFSGNRFSADGSTRWAPNQAHLLPASLYLSRRPAWWGILPFPAIGPDVRSEERAGELPYDNPAQRCFLHVMHGMEGGAESPRHFNASRCYPR